MKEFYIIGKRTVPPGGMKVYGTDYITNSQTVTRKTKQKIKAHDAKDALGRLATKTAKAYGKGAVVDVQTMFYKGGNGWVEIPVGISDAEVAVVEWDEQSNCYAAYTNCPICGKVVGVRFEYANDTDDFPVSEEKATCPHVVAMDAYTEVKIVFGEAHN